MAKDIFTNKNKNFKDIVSALSLENFSIDKNFMIGHSNHLKHNKVIDGPDFNYILNKEGFRSKSFDEFNVNNKNILFAGCSHTFGSGLPESHVWVKKLIDKVSNNNSFDYYNIGIPGAPTQVIIKNILTFFVKVGIPDYLFMLLPETSRGLKWDGNRYASVSYYPKSDGFSEFTKNYSNSYVHEDALLIETMLIHLLESLCKSLNVKFIWSSTIIFQNDFNEAMNFKNYISLDKNLDKYYVKTPEDIKQYGGQYDEYINQYPLLLSSLNKKNINSEPYWAIASDGAHFGSYCHAHMADTFFKHFKLLTSQ